MFGIGKLAQAVVTWYGYKTLGGLLSENFGLIVVLLAFIAVALVFWRLLNRQFPRTGQPFKKWIFKTTMVFFICAFVFVCAFTVFYERKKAEEHGAVPPDKPDQISAS